jgi:anaerobic magnesium-protoporphyrin IX monomethyl ester cyclase
MDLKDIGCFPPLGLFSIFSFLKKNNFQVEFIDFNVGSIPKNKINGDIVGIGADWRTYKNALKIAEQAKSQGSFVVLGGSLVSSLGRTIINRRGKIIDAVIIGDGEIPLLKIARGDNLEKIPNLIFKKQGKIIETKKYEPDLNQYGPIDYSLINLSPYFKNFKKSFPENKNLVVANVYSHKGCAWRNANHKECVFCSIFDKTLRYKNVKTYWREIEQLQELYKINTVYDVSDSFLDNLNWLQELIKIKTPNSPAFYIYSRTNQINQTSINLLTKLGIKNIYLGIESGSQKILNKINKGTTTKNNLSAVKLLAENNIEVDLSFIFGNPEEDKKSIQETFNHFFELSAFGNVNAVEAAFFRPLPGSKSFALLNNKLRGKYDRVDNLPFFKMRREWVENFCNISWHDLKEKIKEFKEIIPQSL